MHVRWMLVWVLTVTTPALAQVSVGDSAADSSQLITVPSRFTLRGDWLRRLPIDDPRAALGLIPGVVTRDFAWGVLAHGDAAIRGGAAGQAMVYIDGAPARSALFGTDRLVPGLAAIDALTVTTGPADVWMEDAAGGVVAYETRSGGDRLTGDLRTESDAPFSNGTSVGYNHLEGWVGGPLPRARGATWFVSALAQGQSSRYRGIGAADLPLFMPAGTDIVVSETAPDSSVMTRTLPRYVQWSGRCGGLGSDTPLGREIRANYGFDCQGARLAMDWSTAIRLHGKLAYQYGNGGLVTLTALAAGRQGRDFPGNLIGDPALYGGRHEWSRLVIANWQHPLALLGGPAILRANLSYGTDRFLAGVLTPEAEVDTRSPWLGMAFRSLTFTGGDVFPLPITADIIRNIRTNSGLRTPYLDRNDLRNSQGGLRLNPYGLQNTGWVVQGVDAGITSSSESLLHGRFQLGWRPHPGQTVTVGIESGRTAAARYTSELLRQARMDAYLVHRTRVGLFAADRVRLGLLEVELGARWDHWDSDGLFPVTPGRTVSHPSFSQLYPNAASDDAEYAAYLADRSIWRPATAHTALSPRADAAYAVSPGSVIHIAYSRQADAPTLQTMFNASNNDLSFTSANVVFGGDVGYAAWRTVEAGIRQWVSGAVVAEAWLYRQAGELYRRYFRPFPDPRSPFDTLLLAVMTKVDASPATGTAIQVVWNPPRAVDGTLAYTIERAAGVTTQQVASALRWSGPDARTGGLLGSLARGSSIAAVLRLTSGVSYTQLVNGGGGFTLADGLAGRISRQLYASHLPWSRHFDLRIDKTWQTRGVRWVVFLDVRNVLNLHSQADVFTETGSAVNDVFRAVLLDPERANLTDEARLAGALQPNGDVALTGSCQAWSRPVNCESLGRVEARFGDGDGVLTMAEFDRSLNAYYEAFFGAWRFYQPGRTARLGVQIGF